MKHSVKSLGLFCDLWAEWSTYLDFIQSAEKITGRDNVASFEGISSEKIVQAMKNDPGLTREMLEKKLSRDAHLEYEKADLIGLKAVHSLMRVTPKEIEEMLSEGRWEAITKLTLLARLHGEGKFYQALKVYLNHWVPEELKRKFMDLVETALEALQSDYRIRRPLNEVDWEKLEKSIVQFLATASAVRIPRDFDFDEAWLKERQVRMRLAEAHLANIEKEYAESEMEITLQEMTLDPVEIYKQAMLLLLEELERTELGNGNLEEALSQSRTLLLRARRLSDSQHIHDYYFWTGAGEDLGQMKNRSLHPRYRLYQMEGYAERMFLSADLTLQDLSHGRLDKSRIRSHYEQHFYFDEAPLYTQEWIANFGPRRSVIFGYKAPDTVEVNQQILAQDRWICQTRAFLIRQGADSQVWGPVATGYTENLRYLLRDGSDASSHSQLIKVLDQLLKQDILGFTQAVRSVCVYDTQGNLLKNTPSVTIGVHIHNADPSVLFETLVHMREIQWHQQRRYALIGTTSSRRAFAKEEQRMALELGISRLGMTNHQLLKAGNQNRVIPNTPRSPDGESFYLTLDDDYVAAPLALQRCIPILLQYPTMAFVQMPLIFRALLEPGHSIGRQTDAAMLQSAFTTIVPGFNEMDARGSRVAEIFQRKRASVPLVFGTNTVYRTTFGKSLLDATGGFVVDSRKVFAGEDTATSMLAMLMGTQPHLFEEIQGAWTQGIHLSEGWVIGDGVDFAPGGQRQKQRYAESNLRVLRTLLLPYWTKGKGIGLLPWKSLTTIVVHLSSYLMVTGLGIMTHLLYPILIFTPWGAKLPQNFLFNYVALTSILLGTYAHRVSGLTVGEFIRIGVMSYHGTFLSHLRGTLSALFLKPVNQWLAFKGIQSSSTLRYIHWGLGTLHLASALFGALNC